MVIVTVKIEYAINTVVTKTDRSNPEIKNLVLWGITDICNAECNGYRL